MLSMASGCPFYDMSHPACRLSISLKVLLLLSSCGIAFTHESNCTLHPAGACWTLCLTTTSACAAHSCTTSRA